MAGDLISNALIYVDAGPTEDGSGGASILLERITSFKATDERGREVKKAIGVRGGAGTITKQGGGKIAMTELRHAPAQIPWRRWLDEGKTFQITTQDEHDEGARDKYRGVQVSKVDRGMDDDGNHTDEIELTYLSIQ